MHIWMAIPELLLIQALQKWLNLHFGPEQSCTNKFRKKQQLQFIMQHTVIHMCVFYICHGLLCSGNCTGVAVVHVDRLIGMKLLKQLCKLNCHKL